MQINRLAASAAVALATLGGQAFAQGGMAATDWSGFNLRAIGGVVGTNLKDDSLGLKMGPTGATVGGGLDYLFRIPSSRVMAGVSVDAQYAFVSETNPTVGKVDVNFVGGAYGLLGYGFDYALPYLKFGVAYTDFSVHGIPKTGPSGCIGSLFTPGGSRIRLGVEYCATFNSRDQSLKPGPISNVKISLGIPL